MSIAESQLSMQSLPAADSDRFQRLLSIINHDFPLEFLIAGELAQFETFAIPSISRLLHRTGLYEDDGVKRLDDTRATMYGIFQNPAGSDEREQMVSHLNWVHSHYQISNEDNLYTLLRMFFLPIEWIQQYGWRSLSQAEIKDMTAEMVTIGKAMKIDFETEDFEQLKAWQQGYRDEHEVYDAANQAVAEGTIKAIQDHFPAWVRPVVPFLIRSLLADEKLLQAMGLKPVNRLEKGGVKAVLKVWQALSKVYRPWRKKPFINSWIMNTYPSYPEGKMDYQELGPRKMIKKRNKAGGCPFH